MVTLPNQEFEHLRITTDVFRQPSIQNYVKAQNFKLPVDALSCCISQLSATAIPWLMHLVETVNFCNQHNITVFSVLLEVFPL